MDDPDAIYGVESPTLTADALWIGPAIVRPNRSVFLQIGMQLDAYEALPPGEAVLLIEVALPLLQDLLSAIRKAAPEGG